MSPETATTGSGERGASLTEYALLLALITVAALSAMAAFGGSQERLLGQNSSLITSAMDGVP